MENLPPWMSVSAEMAEKLALALGSPARFITFQMDEFPGDIIWSSEIWIARALVTDQLSRHSHSHGVATAKAAALVDYLSRHPDQTGFFATPIDKDGCDFVKYKGAVAISGKNVIGASTSRYKQEIDQVVSMVALTGGLVPIAVLASGWNYPTRAQYSLHLERAGRIGRLTKTLAGTGDPDEHRVSLMYPLPGSDLFEVATSLAVRRRHPNRVVVLQTPNSQRLFENLLTLPGMTTLQFPVLDGSIRYGISVLGRDGKITERVDFLITEN